MKVKIGSRFYKIVRVKNNWQLTVIHNEFGTRYSTMGKSLFGCVVRTMKRLKYISIQISFLRNRSKSKPVTV